MKVTGDWHVSTRQGTSRESKNHGTTGRPARDSFVTPIQEPGLLKSGIRIGVEAFVGFDPELAAGDHVM